MRTTQILSRGWKFRRGEQPGAEAAGFDDSGWESVRLPHDWAISGPFAAENDLQVTRIMQDGEMEETRHYGRTGALPHIGTGFYRNVLEIPAEWAGKAFRLEFDGVMSHATVRINGREAGGRAFGYSSFAVDATGLLEPGANVITVRAENRSAASRWYPGAGIYREVRLLTLEPSHFNYNGVRLDASVADLEKRRGRLRLSASHTGTRQARLAVSVSAPGGSCAAAFECSPEGGEIELDAIRLWSPDAPELYTVEIELRENGVAVDRVTLRCGFRLVRFDADAGMFLNGKAFRMNGVCLHHDFGPFGAAFSLPELRRRFGLLKSIGCNALRTSHNPPDPKFLDLADETGFVVIDEAFDCWAAGKVANDYSCDYPAWHRTDLADLIRRDRHHVSVILWSIGNEINEQGLPGGAAVARELAALCHELDPSRPVTAG
ncbi:MAG TPA: beta-galactosidase, partial [Lentisphaeria bacterium]|nr:beta-galactosidase [Lentisphaeria bacterium]